MSNVRVLVSDKLAEAGLRSCVRPRAWTSSFAPA